MQLDKLRQGRHGVSQLVVHFLVFAIRIQAQGPGKGKAEASARGLSGRGPKAGMCVAGVERRSRSRSPAGGAPAKAVSGWDHNAMKGMSSQMLCKEFLLRPHANNYGVGATSPVPVAEHPLA
ncbi:hypothetical protein OMCYN_01688 [cyanobiont of Ornithocercus magnificus]|nr:hypothetical protein OMCYN_01688 [cyanobiont of Ornithocercus magnificus]